MPYYAQSAYYPLPGAPQAAALPPQPQQQQQYAGQSALPQSQLNQGYLRQEQIQAQQQLAYQQQQQQLQQQQQYLEQQNRQQLIQQQQYQQQQQYAQQQQRLQQQQLQQQQYAAQQQRLQQQGYAQQQQYQQVATPSRQLQQQRSASPAAPLYKSSEYIPAGGVYSTGGAYNQPSQLRRVPSRADVNTAIEQQQEPAAFGQGQQRLSQYNAYANYGQQLPQSPIRPVSNSQREPSEYAFDGLNPVYRQQNQQLAQERDLPTARELPSASNVWLGARSLNAPTTVVLDANNNAPLPPRSPARGYSAQQKGYGSGAQAESAYIAIPNDLVYAQNNQQRAYTNYGQESRPAYASSSRTNQASSTPQLKPEAARALYAALSSENVRTALERDAPIVAPAPAYATYNGQKLQGRAFVIPAEQKYSEYNVEDLNNLRSVIDR